MGGGQLLSNNLTGIVLNTAFQSGVVNTPVVLVSNLDEAVSNSKLNSRELSV